MDEIVLKYTSQYGPKCPVPEYETMSMSMGSKAGKLLPKPQLTPERLDKLFSQIDFSEMGNGKMTSNGIL